MKKLLVVLMVLTMATIANAALLISVDGVENPPDTSIYLAPSQSVVIDVTGDGLTPGPTDLFLINEPAVPIQAGTMAGGVLTYQGSMSSIGPATPADIAMLQSLGYNPASAIYVVLADGGDPPLPLLGKLVDEVIFHCDAPNIDATLSLINITWVYDPDNDIYVPFITTFDTQQIHQIPEPITMALLGLGGLFLRRRK